MLSNGDGGGILIKCDRCLACVRGRLRAGIDTNGVCLTASVSFWRGLVGIQNEVQGQGYLCGQMVVFFVVLFVSAIESFGVYRV